MRRETNREIHQNLKAFAERKERLNKQAEQVHNREEGNGRRPEASPEPAHEETNVDGDRPLAVDPSIISRMYDYLSEEDRIPPGIEDLGVFVFARTDGHAPARMDELKKQGHDIRYFLITGNYDENSIGLRNLGISLAQWTAGAAHMVYHIPHTMMIIDGRANAEEERVDYGMRELIHGAAHPRPIGNLVVIDHPITLKRSAATLERYIADMGVPTNIFRRGTIHRLKEGNLAEQLSIVEEICRLDEFVHKPWKKTKIVNEYVTVRNKEEKVEVTSTETVNGTLYRPEDLEPLLLAYALAYRPILRDKAYLTRQQEAYEQL